MFNDYDQTTDSERDLAVDFARERFGDNYATIIQIGQRLKGMTADKGMYQFPDFAQFGGVEEIKDQLESQCSAKVMKEAEAVVPRIVRYWTRCEGSATDVGSLGNLGGIMDMLFNQGLGQFAQTGSAEQDRRMADLRNKALRIQAEMTSTSTDAAREDAQKRLSKIQSEMSTMTTEMLSDVTIKQETYKQCALIAYIGRGCVTDEIYDVVISGR